MKDFALGYGFQQDAGPFDMREILRPLLFVPPSMPLGVLLQKMQQERIHMALVIDEYGGTDGLVTIEDLIEQVIGEIEDEHDDEPTEMFTKADNGIWIVDARAELDDVGERIDPKLADVDEDIDTLGGLAFLLAGKVADKGTRLEHESGWTLEVEDSDDRRINRIKLHPPKA